jgi:hypothetical protein
MIKLNKTNQNLYKQILKDIDKFQKHLYQLKNDNCDFLDLAYIRDYRERLNILKVFFESNLDPNKFNIEIGENDEYDR